MAKNGVDGVYDKDPKKHKDAKMFNALSQEEMLEKHLNVMDLTAATMCRDNHIDIIVFNMNKEGNIVKAVKDKVLGTKVTWEAKK